MVVCAFAPAIANANAKQAAAASRIARTAFAADPLLELFMAVLRMVCKDKKLPARFANSSGDALALSQGPPYRMAGS
jgi:hypothetical protein